MDYKYRFTNSAKKDLKKIEQKTALRILKKLQFFLSLKNPLEKAKELKGFEIKTYRFRIGDYRIVFREDKKLKKLVVLVVLKIKHRKSVYK